MTSTIASTGTGERFAGFDGLRAIAALSIVALHVASATGAVAATRLGAYFARLDVGVTVFFVISGFLLYRPFVAAHLGLRPAGSLRRYCWRRAMRIYPAYWVALTAAVLVFGSTELRGGWDYARHYLLVQIYQPDYGLAGIVPAWTLAVEVSFYALLPVYAFALGRATRRLPVQRRVRVELAVPIGLYVAAMAWRWVLVTERGTDAVSARWLPALADWFALGLLLAVVHAAAELDGRCARIRNAADRHGLALVVGAAAAYVTVCNIGLPVDGTSGNVADDLTRQVLFGAVAAFLVASVALGRGGAAVQRALEHPLAVTIGTVSYGVFLWHFDWIEQLVAWGALDWVRDLRTPSVMFLTVALSTATATASWLLVERPLLRGRRARRMVRA